MELINKKVIHKVFGAGTISSVIDGGYLKIEFPAKSITMVFPQCIKDGFLRFADETFHQQVLYAIAATEASKQEAQPKPVPPLSVSETPANPALKVQTVQKKVTPKFETKQTTYHGRQIFLVHQGKTFDDEAEGGYLWAPISTKSGTQPHHWSIMKDVRPGDVIFHNVDGKIVALSVAKTKGYNCNQPRELQSQDAWEQTGRRVDCEYTLISTPIKTLSYKKDLIHYSYLKYSPFNVNGTGNQGYLFSLNRTLARMFLKDLVNNNRYLEALEYVPEILSEEHRYATPKIPELKDYLRTLDEMASDSATAQDGTELKVDWIRIEIPLLNLSLRPGTLVNGKSRLFGAPITAVYEKDERDPKKIRSWYQQDLLSCVQKLCDGLHDAAEATCIIDTEEFLYK